MKRHVRTRLVFRVGTALLALGFATLVSAQEPKKQEPDKTPSSGTQKRTYDFKEAGKQMEYALFIPSKFDKEKKTPLLIALHGLGGNPQQMIRSQGLTEQAEKYGYIVVAPMGYNSSGWYGSRGPGGGGFGAPGGKGAPGGIVTPPGTVLSSRVQDNLKLTDEQKKKFEELQKEVDAKVQKILTEDQNKQLKDLKENAGRGIGGGADAPRNLGELSEKDVMNVLEIVRKEFNIDEKRIYLIGHSMGGAGTWHLGSKYADTWAGLAPIAPAAFGQPTGLDKIKHIPVFVVQGDNDNLVPAAGTRRWVDKLKELGVTHEYLEIPGGGHGDVIGKGMPKIFEFFEKQQKEKQQQKEDKGK
jgi:poly(3-hydroxybutyrate) depolymerase